MLDERIVNARNYLAGTTFPPNSKYQDCFKFERGFSVQRHYPKQWTYVPPKYNSGEDDVVALLHVIVDGTFSQDGKRAGISISVTPYSKYIAKHPTYDPNDEASPSQESINSSKKTPKPQQIEVNGELFFDEQKNSLVTEDGNEISLEAALDHAYSSHLKTIIWYRRIPRYFKSWLVEKFSSIAIWLIMLFLFCARRITNQERKNPDHMLLVNATKNILGDPNAKTTSTLPKAEPESFLGVSGGKTAILFYAFLVCFSGLIVLLTPWWKKFLSLETIAALSPFRDKLAVLFSNNLFVVALTVIIIAALGLLGVVVNKVCDRLLKYADYLAKKRYVLRVQRFA